MGYLIPAIRDSYLPTALPKKSFKRWFKQSRANLEPETQAGIPLPMTSMEDTLLLAAIPFDSPLPDSRNFYPSAQIQDGDFLLEDFRQYHFNFR